MYEMVMSTCKGCGADFMQLTDPGRQREYHDDACRQRAFRRRHAGRAAKIDMEAAWIEREAHRQREWERGLRRRKQPVPEVVTPSWTRPVRGEDREVAKWRRWCGDLLRAGDQAEDPTPYREAAARVRRRYKL